MHVKLIRPVAPRLLVPRSVISQKFLSVIYNLTSQLVNQTLTDHHFFLIGIFLPFYKGLEKHHDLRKEQEKN